MEQLTAALNLTRRLPPQNLKKNVVGLVRVTPTLADELLQRVDRPLEVRRDEKAGRYFVCCDYNRDGNSYRSPWSNTYDPPLPGGEEGSCPSEHLRRLEQQYNDVFDAYRHAYFEGGVSSVYLWETPEGDAGFAAAFLIHKEIAATGLVEAATWDSIHVAEVQEAQTQAHYKVTSTCLINAHISPEQQARAARRQLEERGVDPATASKETMESHELLAGPIVFGGHLARQETEHKKLTDETVHIAHLGAMIESLENGFRKSLEHVYLQKAREIVNGARRLEPEVEKARTNAFQMDLAKAVALRLHKKGGAQ